LLCVATNYVLGAEECKTISEMFIYLTKTSHDSCLFNNMEVNKYK